MLFGRLICRYIILHRVETQRDKGNQRLFFCKISVRRSKYCLSRKFLEHVKGWKFLDNCSIPELIYAIRSFSNEFSHDFREWIVRISFPKFGDYFFKKSPEHFGINCPPKIYGYSVSSQFRQGVVIAKTFETAKVPLKHPNRQMILRVVPN